ncbi:MAG: hypothetical protein HETSPECPRED_005081 [Heterodermia speciosa]|uniref:Lysine-specific metallo-endopeptidase domain-containing protein n=1 Tax=Heterodermia speciosa TaxID=116794 RepID=A0A8H3FIC5_9LECA|nr:MAG: hypothetical protein HETSPECPRED_005081 [Heterodermia speciosa]
MHFLSSLALATSTCLVLANAVPLQGTSATPSLLARNRLSKRTNPIIGEGIDTTDPDRGAKLLPREGLPQSGAFDNVQQMLNYALTATNYGINSDSEIFTHYFLESHRDRVKRILQKLSGNLKESGADELGQITFQGVDTPNNGDDAGCAKQGTIMYTEYYDTEAPVTVVCEDAWVYPDRDDAEACDSDEMSDELRILASIVVHEYTHWDWFLKSIHGGEIVDTHGTEEASGYGLTNVYYDLDKKYALYNADSYAWYLTEVFWSVLCAKSFKAPD